MKMWGKKKENEPERDVLEAELYEPEPAELDNVIVLTDEDGNDEEFEWLDTLAIHGKTYVVAIPTDEDAEEVVIFSYDAAEDTLVGLADEEEMDTVFAIFKEKNKELFDFAD